MTHTGSTRRWALILAGFLCLLFTPAGAAPPPLASPSPSAISSDIRSALGEVDAAGRLLDAARAQAGRPAVVQKPGEIRALLEEAQTRSAGAALVIEPELALVLARIEKLGPPPTDHAEAPEVLAQRTSLSGSRVVLDSALKRINLIQVEADQIRSALATQAADATAERMNQRTQSPLSPALWGAALQDLPQLGRRFAEVGSELTPDRAARPGLLVTGLVLAIVMVGPGMIALRWLGRRHTGKRSDVDERLRRSAYATWILLVGSIIPALAGTALVVGIEASGVAAPGISLLASGFVVSLVIGAFVVALSNALLLVDTPEWRLARIDTGEARALRPFGWIAAIVIVLATSSDAFITLIKPPATIATALQATIALFCVGLVIGLLIVVGRIRARDDGVGGVNVFYGRLPTLALILLWPASLFILFRGAMGYVVYATETAMWLVWGSVVLLTFYLLARLIDDACRVFFAQQNHLARSARARFGVADNTLLQFGVLLSAGLRLALLLIAGVMLLLPFGAGFTSFVDLFGRLGQGLRIGEIVISPAAVVRAIVVLAVVLAVFRALRHWLTTSYLPTTGLDAAAANSIGVITGYLGVTAAVLWALAAFGVQVQQLAFLVSALSVGIGFGLQAITQNFVSGLILLTERPVRIGDRIKVSDQTGRIARISVRATQIIADDGSRLVVPNSELITKTVQTSAVAPSVVRGEIAVDFDEDLDMVRDTLLKAASAHDTALPSPTPSVFVRAIVDGRILLGWSIATNAAAGDHDRVRGEIWLNVIQQLRARGVTLPRPSSTEEGPP